MIIGNKEYKDEDVQNEIFDKRIQGTERNIKEEYAQCVTTEEKISFFETLLKLK